MITLNDYLYSGDTIFRILQKYTTDLRKDAKKHRNEIDMMHCNFLVQIRELLEHNDFLTAQSRKITEFYKYMAKEYPYLAFTFKGRIKSLIRAEQKFNSYVVEYIYHYYEEHGTYPSASQLKTRLSCFRDLIAYRIVICMPKCHYNSEEERTEAELKCLYEIANVLPDFLEERGFTAEPAHGVQESISPLMDESVRPYYRDYISHHSEDQYQSLHITFYDNSSRSYMEVQLRTKTMDDVAEIGAANHLGYEKKQEKERSKRDAIPEGKNRYFDEAYEGEYPAEAPFTISELEEIYPTASGKSKQDKAYKEAAMQATYELQHGRRGYQALLKHILNVSVTDLKRNYANLKVDFDLWKGESDAQPYIPDMVQKMKDGGYAYVSDNALVVDVKEDTDTKEVPPCMLLKSDGASLYTTTDLATIVERMKLYNPDEIIYVVDKRQEMHFIQVFRCARKCGLVTDKTELKFLGFGTMNGKDGKPFKTRDGGVMRLEYLLKDINEEMLKKIQESRPMEEKEAEETAKIVGLSAVKYGDLSNQASKDYIFDVERFTSSEGNTGPYILYTIVRIKSILRKYEESGKKAGEGKIGAGRSDSEKALQLELSKLNSVMETAFEECAPHKICAYIYDLANAFNKFYHETKILATDDMEAQSSWISLLLLTRRVLETCIDVLGFEAPEKM